jgi:hypothetical protein
VATYRLKSSIYPGISLALAKITQVQQKERERERGEYDLI